MRKTSYLNEIQMHLISIQGHLKRQMFESSFILTNEFFMNNLLDKYCPNLPRQ